MKRGFEEMLKYVVIGINLLLTFFFAGGYYAIVGILLVILSTIVAAFLPTSEVGHFIIRSQIKSYNEELLGNEQERNSCLVSIAFLILSLKVGAGIALIVEGLAIVLVAFCILIASGWLIEGRASGMSVGLAYNISKLVMKVYLFLNSLVDKLAMQIVKIEFQILEIEET